MGDIFDGTRRKISRHVTRNVADEVLKAKNPEFTERAMQVADEMLTDPAFKKVVAKTIQRKAVHYMRQYFNSEEFIAMCKAQARKMVRDED